MTKPNEPDEKSKQPVSPKSPAEVKQAAERPPATTSELKDAYLPSLATTAESKEVDATAAGTPSGGQIATLTSVPAVAAGLDRNALYVLMLNLLYPAVLGTIFYTFLQFIFQGLWLTDRAEAKKFIYAFGVVCHYHIDFLYVYSFEVYKRLAFFVDLLIVILLYRAFYALTGQPTADYRAFFLCFLLIYLIFLPHEVIIWWRYKKSDQRELMRVHVWMFIHEGVACVYFIACILRPGLANSFTGAIMLLAISFDYALILRARTRHRKII